jgi:ADP-ribosylglycohydrolase
MPGAIIGDIVGSVYEWHNIKTKDFPLFRDDCFFTDDTVMTIATADAIMKARKRGDFPGEDDFIDAYKIWGCRYPNATPDRRPRRIVIFNLNEWRKICYTNTISKRQKKISTTSRHKCVSP